MSYACDKEIVRPAHVYVAPPDYHMLLESETHFSLSKDKAVAFSRPSIDVLFESAADVFSSRMCGVLLSGNNTDGVRGLKAIQSQGGKTFVQSPETALSPAMVQAALAAHVAYFVGTPVEIGQSLQNLIRERNNDNS